MQSDKNSPSIYIPAAYKITCKKTGAHTLIQATDAVRSYYKEEKLRCCPTAIKPLTDEARGTFAAWGRVGYRGGWLT